MFGRNVWFMSLLVTAVVVPYHLSGDSQWSSMNNWWHSMWSDASAQADEPGAYRNAWPGAKSAKPTATTSPMPAHYSRRPIQSLPTNPQPKLPLAPTPFSQQSSLRSQVHASRFQPNSTNFSLPSAKSRPRFHDWMPVNQTATGEVGTNRGSISGVPTRQAPSGDSAPPLCGPNAPCMSHLINFEATPAWVMNNWQRVSTRLADFDLEGLRVPVVTGTGVEDLVGSMTYYFDHHQNLQRVMFDGYTGDPAPLVNVMTNKYQLKAEPWLGAGFYSQRDSADKIASVMRVTHAPVVRASDSRRRFTVEFELNHPESSFGLSDRFAAVIQADRHNKKLTVADQAEPVTKTKDEIETEELIRRLEAEADADGQAAQQSGSEIESFQVKEAKRPAAGAQAARSASPEFSPPTYNGPSYASNPPSVSSPSYSARSPSGIAPSGMAPSGGAPSGYGPSGYGPPRKPESPVKPKPLNGSAEPQQRGFWESLMEGGSSDGPKLYPSQLPTNGQTYFPPPR